MTIPFDPSRRAFIKRTAALAAIIPAISLADLAPNAERDAWVQQKVQEVFGDIPGPRPTHIDPSNFGVVQSWTVRQQIPTRDIKHSFGHMTKIASGPSYWVADVQLSITWTDLPTPDLRELLEDPAELLLPMTQGGYLKVTGNPIRWQWTHLYSGQTEVMITYGLTNVPEFVTK